jgi:hypothetical protein
LSSTRDFHLLLFHLHLISSSSVSTTPYHTSISAALHTSHPYHTSISAAFHTSHLHIRSLPHLTPPYPQPSTPHTSISAAFHTSHLRITPPYPQPSIPHTSVAHLHIRSLPYHDDDTYFPHLASISRARSLPHLTHTEVFPELSSSFIAVHSPAIEPPRHTRHRVQQPHCRA